MSERRETRDQSRHTEIEFFVARKFARAAIFESLILEFVTRLRERRRKPKAARNEQAQNGQKHLEKARGAVSKN